MYFFSLFFPPIVPSFLFWDKEKDYTLLRSELTSAIVAHRVISLYITFWVIRFAQLLQFQHWYIIILWYHCIIIFIEVAHHHCFSFVTTYLLLLIFDPSSLRHFVVDQDFCFCCRSRYLLRKGRFIPFLCCQSFIFTHSFAVFSVLCVDEPASVDAIAHQWSADGGCHLWQSGDAHVPISNEIASGISVYRLCFGNLCPLL